MSEEDDDGESGPPKKKVSGKKLILFILLPIILLGGAGAAVFMLGLLDPLLGVEQAEEEEAVEEEVVAEVVPPGVFYEMEEMTVSLSGTGNRRNFLVVGVQIEMEDDAGVARIEAERPRLVSEFNIFLRELRVEELNGSEGAYLVREELYRRASQVLSPTPVRNLLLEKLLVQ